MTNPHGWIVLDVKGETGAVVTWRVETGPTNTLMRAGLRKADFIPGTEIIVRGFLAKSGRPIANGREVRERHAFQRVILASWRSRSAASIGVAFRWTSRRSSH